MKAKLLAFGFALMALALTSCDDTTGGIGGVHRGAETTMDVSADLEELANTNVAVICAGAKSILDLGLTLEYLETHGVPVLGYQTKELPAFYTRKSGFNLDYKIDSPEELAKLLYTKWELGLNGGAVIANPIPEEYSMDSEVINKVIKDAVAEGDVPRAGKGTMTDCQFESHEAKSSQANFASNRASSSNHVTKTSSNHQSAKAQTDMESRKGTAAQSGMFRQLTGGLESVITAIVEAMPSNVHLHTGTLVSDIRYVDGVYAIDVVNQCNDSCGRQSMADHVIISTPPATYRQWFKDDQGFDFLRSMEQSSCAIAIMSFDKSTFDGDLKGSGLLITRNTDTPLTACTILNQKWPQTTPDDKVVLRVFIGKPGNDVVERLSEEELSELAVKEIQHIMGFSVKPEWVRINRLIHCMPQYNVGHRAGIKAVREHVAEHYPNLHLIGTPFDGIGIPDGVKQAKELVEKLVNDK